MKNSLNRRFGSRIFIKYQHHRFCNFIGSFSLFICSPLQLYLKHFASVSCPVLSLCCCIFRPILPQSFSHLLPLFLCILPWRRDPKPGYWNMSTNASVLVIRNDTRATLSFSQGRYKSVIRKLAEKHPEDCRIIADNKDGSICAHVPVSWLRISPPRQYTEEQRQQMGERLKQNRSENTATQG